jgi:hypothetical protein
LPTKEMIIRNSRWTTLVLATIVAGYVINHRNLRPPNAPSRESRHAGPNAVLADIVSTPIDPKIFAIEHSEEGCLAKGDLAGAETQERLLLGQNMDHSAVYLRLADLKEKEGLYSEAADNLGMIITGKARKVPNVIMEERSPEMLARFRDDLLKGGGHAAVVAGFDPIRDEKYNLFSDEPLGGHSGTSYSMRDMNRMGISDEEIIDLRHAFWLTGVNPNDPSIKPIFENTLKHWPRNYEIWHELQVLSQPADQFKVVEREYIAADPAHRLRMKKYYSMDWNKLDAEVNPQP